MWNGAGCRRNGEPGTENKRPAWMPMPGKQRKRKLAGEPELCQNATGGETPESEWKRPGKQNTRNYGRTRAPVAAWRQ